MDAAVVLVSKPNLLVLYVIGLRGGREKTHGSSPSTSGNTNEKPSEIQTRRRQCTIDHGILSLLSLVNHRHERHNKREKRCRS